VESTIYNKGPLIITPTSRIIISLTTFNRDILIRAKILRLNKIYSYKGTSEGKYLYWFRDVNIKFLISLKYFTTDYLRIVYYIDSLENNPLT